MQELDADYAIVSLAFIGGRGFLDSFMYSWWVGGEKKRTRRRRGRRRNGA